MIQTSQTPKFSTTNKLFCNLGDSLLGFLAFLLITPTLCLWFTPTLTPVIAIIAILSGMAFSLYLNRNNLKYGLLVVVLLALIVVGIYQLSNLFVDTSWDGWSYHQPAVIALIEGWNPIKEPDLKLWWESVKTAKEYKLVLGDLGSNFRWVTHYAKASWIMSAVIAKITGNIESAKFINLLAIIACFFNAYKLFKSFNISLFSAVVFALLYAANTIAISQFTTAYIDGFLGSIFGILLASSILWLKNHKLEDAFNILFSSLILINIKFSGIAYLGIVYAMILIGVFIFRRSAIYKTVVLLGSSFTIGICIGYNPYLVNLKDHGYLFYPLNEVDILARQVAPEFLQKNRIVKFFWSMYAKVDNSGQDLPKIKFPLTVSKSERNLFRYVCDIRFSGFGPLFGFIFTVFLFCTIISLKDIFKSIELKLISLALFTIIIATILFPESWWARYVPQLWYAPVLLSFSLFITGRLRAAFLLALSIFINLAIVANDRITSQYELAGIIRNDFYKILSEKLIKIYPTNICFTIPIVYHAAQHGVHISVTDSPNHCKPTADGHFQTCG